MTVAKLIAENRRARYDYFLEETLEAGLYMLVAGALMGILSWATWDLLDDLLGRSFVATHLDRITRPHVLRRLREHQAEGHHLVLASASPQFVVERLGCRHPERGVGPESHCSGRLQNLQWHLHSKLPRAPRLRARNSLTAEA